MVNYPNCLAAFSIAGNKSSECFSLKTVPSGCKKAIVKARGTPHSLWVSEFYFNKYPGQSQDDFSQHNLITFRLPNKKSLFYLLISIRPMIEQMSYTSYGVHNFRKISRSHNLTSLPLRLLEKYFRSKSTIMSSPP